MSFLVRDSQYNSFDQDLQVTTRIKGTSVTTVNISPGAVGANSTVNASVTIRGVRAPVAASAIPGDLVDVYALAALPTGIVLGTPIVTAANTVSVPFINPTAAPQTPAAANYAVMIVHVGQPTGLDG